MKKLTAILKSILVLLILKPLALIWDSIYRFRRFAFTYGVYRQNEFVVPIISVGNLTFGGTGKTPFTLWLAEYLDSLGMKVMILMRGYKGRLEYKSGILRGGKRLNFNPSDYGDEALLLSRRLKNTSIVVGKNRSENLDHYFSEEQPDIVLLDDGHQHLKLGRNLNILLFDSLLPLDRYKVAPMGYMREGFSALKDADLIVLGRVDQVSLEKKTELISLLESHLKQKVPIAEVKYVPTGLFSSVYTKSYSVEQIVGLRAICIAGLASPDSFFQLLESLGVEILSRESFPDHYDYKVEDIDRLIQLATDLDAMIITTEKDMVKIRRVADYPRLVYLEIQMEFVKGEKATREIIARSFLLDH